MINEINENIFNIKTVIFLSFFLYPKQARTHIKCTFKSYHTRLISIRVGIDHNGDKTLPYNTTALSGFELDTSS